ncbi:52 kDa repressor of the inhibitor of the protein kinase-like [Dendronephthya gigantea]|uniref:52 kDa repressor of the inhibitor of the protein kinase-like n=1 Tax=Dendronephthya gigantea TaxID=151771 RepID=UPI00106A8DAC|nr:52 kDa repressor of the inhibitor of the protein kinase-like [Dendronephthya gigantea]
MWIISIFSSVMKVSTTAKKKKIAPILPKKASQASPNILKFFPKAEKPTFDFRAQKAPNETFSSAEALAAHKKVVTSAPSGSVGASTKEPQSATSMLPTVEVKQSFANNFDISLYRERVKGMDNSEKEVQENRSKLASIIDTVVFCGRLGLPLRGHRDDAKYHPEVGSYSTGGVGNFVESLNFRVRAGDKILEDHLKTCGKNISYISKTSQNKIISCCGQVISDKIIQDVKQSKFFTIIADEAADSSHKEQLSLVLWFVDSDMTIREEFISFLNCKWGLSGAQLAKLILDASNDLSLPIDDYRGQGYDGYNEALTLATKVNIEESKLRTVGRQTTRANHPYKTVSEYYKRIITIPLIDHLNSSLQARFDTDSVNVYKGLSIVPTKLLSLSSKGIDWKENFKIVANFYYDDLPNPLALLSLWDTYWKTYEGPHPSNIATTLKAVSFEGFENIKVILRILGTLPITSCECERSISSLRNLKNYLRSTMVEKRLNGFALMKIHQEIVPDVEKVIDKFLVGNT